MTGVGAKALRPSCYLAQLAFGRDEWRQRAGDLLLWRSWIATRNAAFSGHTVHRKIFHFFHDSALAICYGIYFSQVQKRISVETRPPVDLSTFVTWLMHDAVLYNCPRLVGCFRAVRKFETFPAMHCRTHLRRTRLEVARRILGDGSRVELIRCPENEWT